MAAKRPVSPPVGHPCSCCGSANAPLRCQRCRLAYYCDKQCQLDDWRRGEHKHTCGKVNLPPVVAQEHLELVVGSRVQARTRHDRLFYAATVITPVDPRTGLIQVRYVTSQYEEGYCCCFLRRLPISSFESKLARRSVRIGIRFPAQQNRATQYSYPPPSHLHHRQRYDDDDTEKYLPACT